MKTKVINLISSPSGGKSVCAGLIFAELKIRGFVTEYAQEYIKNLIWRGELEAIKNQYWVTYQQYLLLRGINNKVQYIVTDGSLIHGLYYNKTYHDNVSNIEKTDTKIREWISEFDNIYIFLERGDYKFEQEGRIHTYEQSLEIQKDLKNLLDEMGLEYLTIKSDRNNIDKIVEYILAQ